MITLPRLSNPCPDGVLTSPHGMRKFEGQPAHLHKGIDIGAPMYAPVLAPCVGTILSIAPPSHSGGYGWMIVMQCALGPYRMRFSHLAAGSMLVKEGQGVRAGDLIARVGSTGMSTGPHLDFEVFRASPSDFTRNRFLFGLDAKNYVDPLEALSHGFLFASKHKGYASDLAFQRALIARGAKIDDDGDFGAKSLAAALKIYPDIPSPSTSNLEGLARRLDNNPIINV